MPFNEKKYNFEWSKNPVGLIRSLIDEFKTDLEALGIEKVQYMERFNAFVTTCRKCQENIKPNLQALIGNHFKQLVACSRDPVERRIMMQKLAAVTTAFPANFKSIDVIGGDNKFNYEEWSGSLMQVKIKPDASGVINPKPKRIISFHPNDFDNKEVFEAVKISFLKHNDAEECLVCCSREDIIYFGAAACETLVLLGHGSIYIEGGPNPRHENNPSEPRLLSKQQAEKERKSARVFLGPFEDIAENVAKNTVELLAKLPMLTHCRLTICMGGLTDSTFLDKDVHYKKDKAYDEKSGRASATIVWGGSKAGIVFHPHSIAGMIWDELNIRDPQFSERNFALTATPLIINPIPESKDTKGHFEGTSRNDRWSQKVGYADKSAFWAEGVTRLEKTKSITLGTVSSSKVSGRIKGKCVDGDEFNHEPPTYKKIS